MWEDPGVHDAVRNALSCSAPCKATGGLESRFTLLNRLERRSRFVRLSVKDGSGSSSKSKMFRAFGEGMIISSVVHRI